MKYVKRFYKVMKIQLFKMLSNIYVSIYWKVDFVTYSVKCNKVM